MGLFPAVPKSIERAASLIQEGGLVAFPTETVYGLGADALNPMAVAKIFEVKNRPSFDPLIVHVCDPSWVDFLCDGIPSLARKLIGKFWPGPLTLILPKKKCVPDIVTSGLQTVAVRMPSHPVALDLIKAATTPLAAPSANPFEYLSPTTAQHVQTQLGDRIDMILDGGPCLIGVESTILDLSDETPRLLRHGGLPMEELEKEIGQIHLFLDFRSSSFLSPGQMHHHYAPRTPLKILEKEISEDSLKGSFGLLAFKALPHQKLNYKKIEILSEKGDLREAAAHLFSCLHRLDEAGLDEIHVEPVPRIGLGLAIMNRLTKASSK